MQSWVTERHHFLPVFMARDQTSATPGPVEVDFNCSQDGDYTNFNGFRSSLCPPPCTQTHIKVNMIEEGTEVQNKTTCYFMFSQTLMITRNFYQVLLLKVLKITGKLFPQVFSPAEALAIIGGSLGLWLGLGVLQLVQLCWWVTGTQPCSGSHYRLRSFPV